MTVIKIIDETLRQGDRKFLGILLPAFVDWSPSLVIPMSIRSADDWLAMENFVKSHRGCDRTVG